MTDTPAKFQVREVVIPLARQVIPTLQCDRCKKVEPIEDVKDIPAGWYQITVGCENVSGKRDAGKLDFCGLTCIGQWAKERRQALADDELLKCPYCERELHKKGYQAHVNACEKRIEAETAP